MGTVVLRPHECLKTRFPCETFRSHTPSKTGRKSDAEPTRPGRRKSTSPLGFAVKENGDYESKCRTAAKFSAKSPVMGKVTILKRGDALKLTKDDIKTVIFEEHEKSAFRSISKGEEALKMTKNDIKTVIVDDDKDLVLCSTRRLGPEPEMVPKQIRLADLKTVAGVYAGSAISASPSPSSLPFPAFFAKKDVTSMNEVATKDLRRLLRLDLP